MKQIHSKSSRRVFNEAKFELKPYKEKQNMVPFGQNNITLKRLKKSNCHNIMVGLLSLLSTAVSVSDNIQKLQVILPNLCVSTESKQNLTGKTRKEASMP